MGETFKKILPNHRGFQDNPKEEIRKVKSRHHNKRRHRLDHQDQTTKKIPTH